MVSNRFDMFLGGADFELPREGASFWVEDIALSVVLNMGGSDGCGGCGGCGDDGRLFHELLIQQNSARNTETASPSHQLPVNTHFNRRRPPPHCRTIHLPIMTLQLLRSSIRRLPGRLAGVRGIQTTQPTITKPNTPNTPNASATNAVPTAAPVMDGPSPKDLAESVEAAEKARHMQAPNRATTWSRSQRPRELGMVGPRFEQTIIEMQPAPYAAIELIHQVPVRWSEKKVVECNGGG
jgi:hypothetical protein